MPGRSTIVRKDDPATAANDGHILSTVRNGADSDSVRSIAKPATGPNPRRRGHRMAARIKIIRVTNAVPKLSAVGGRVDLPICIGEKRVPRLIGDSSGTENA